jgi:hypothetical protein
MLSVNGAIRVESRRILDDLDQYVGDVFKGKLVLVLFVVMMSIVIASLLLLLLMYLFLHFLFLSLLLDQLKHFVVLNFVPNFWDKIFV